MLVVYLWLQMPDQDPILADSGDGYQTVPVPSTDNQEITDEVADGPQSVLFPQAHNRLHAQKAIIYQLLKG